MKVQRVGALAAAVVWLWSVAPASAATAATERVEVIVIARGSAADAAAAVERAGGTTTRELRIIHGVAAVVPSSALGSLSSDRRVGSVDVDAALEFSGAATAYSASNDFGSMFNVARSVGVNQLWNQKATGQGIGVALIDSGVTKVAGLAGGNVVDGPDLSLDAGIPAVQHLDQFGHGTHLAGIIAGRDTAALDYGGYNNASSFTGMAPDATLVNVKVGASDGAVDVSQVIAGLDWVVAHKDDPGLNIRVVNLSFGTDSTQPYRLDPLAYAAEAAWRAGIVVVVAAGNDGNSTSVLTNPATDPYVIAVGSDGHYDKDGNKLYVSSFSNAGNAGRVPDLVAPGQSMVSLRTPGSNADVFFPGGRVNDPRGRFFRGSGTSQSAAVVSGVVASLLSRYPTLTPDQVKGVLRQYATPLPGVATQLQGAGEITASKLAGLPMKSLPSYVQSWPRATGAGSLEAARGSAHLRDAAGVELRGEATVFGVAFDGAAWASSPWDAASWAGGTWSGRSWAGDAWTRHSWTESVWTRHSWTGESWDGRSWTGRSWTGTGWSGATWSGRSWTGTTWT